VPWTRRPAWQLRAGLTIYDVLASRGGLPRHRHAAHHRLHELQPALTDEARHGFTFFDGRAIAPERLTLELALEARAAGASIFNHSPVSAIGTGAGTVASLTIEASGERHEIPTRAVVNAAGPWVDCVRALAGGDPPPLLGATRGTHIVVAPDRPFGRDAVFSTARSDGRVFFAVPQDGLVLIGTTDIRDAGEPGSVAPTRAELDYLLEEARSLLPGMDLDVSHILYAYAGLRPLQRDPGGPEAAITRRHVVVDHAAQGGPDGLFSVLGGKLSTFRPLAHDVMSLLDATAPRRGTEAPSPPSRWDLAAADLPPKARRRLRRYGTAVSAILDHGTEPRCDHAGAIAGEVLHAASSELASSLPDILMRRTGIAWGSCRGLCCHREAARLAASVLGWDPERIDREVADYQRHVDTQLPLPALLKETTAHHAPPT
jgi:glycerol-3-phosphate dehydrogenase